MVARSGGAVAREAKISLVASSVSMRTKRKKKTIRNKRAKRKKTLKSKFTIGMFGVLVVKRKVTRLKIA